MLKKRVSILILLLSLIFIISGCGGKSSDKEEVEQNEYEVFVKKIVQDVKNYNIIEKNGTETFLGEGIYVEVLLSDNLTGYEGIYYYSMETLLNLNLERNHELLKLLGVCGPKGRVILIFGDKSKSLFEYVSIEDTKQNGDELSIAGEDKIKKVENSEITEVNAITTGNSLNAYLIDYPTVTKGGILIKYKRIIPLSAAALFYNQTENIQSDIFSIVEEGTAKIEVALNEGLYSISSKTIYFGKYNYINNYILPEEGDAIFVNKNYIGTEDGTETRPFTTIQSAVNIAKDGDIIKVAEGIYNENIILPQDKGVKLYGAYQNGNFNNRNISIYSTTIRGYNNLPVINIEYSGNYGQYHIYEINGFTIENGQRGIYAMNWGNGGNAELKINNNIIQNNSGLIGSNDNGGGISSRGMIAEIKNNTIRNNKCGKGAGLALQLNSTEYSFLIEGNLIENNEIYSDHGAGAGVQGYKGVIKNNTFKNNKILESWGWGGGLIVDGNQFTGFTNNIYVELSGNTYIGNEVPSGGSGLFIDEGANVRIKNELIIKNICKDSFRNGALYVDGERGSINAKTILENCTIADNIGADYSYGHAIFIEGGSEVIVRNSIFWDNKSSDNQNDFYVNDTSSLVVEYSTYVDGKMGDGNFSITESIKTNPLFADTSSNNYYLKSKAGRWNTTSNQWVIDTVQSPAIDSGKPSSSYSNEPLPNGGRVNMGAYGNTVYASKTFTENTVAADFQVGPSRSYKSLKEVAGLLKPGDVVEVDGDCTYEGGIIFTQAGTEMEKIHIKGIRVNGKRPVITGGENGVHFQTPWPYNTAEGGHHYIFEGFEITNATVRGIFHQARDLTIRDCFVYDCITHGILGADEGSGSLLLEYTEVARCGDGGSRHQIYMATDEVNNPGSIFRMQHCYVHDANGGNNVKTRAERNEIYYNWIEGGYYHELELIGPDSDADGSNPLLKREDSDVVGNVLIKKQTYAGNNPDFYVIRIGGDGTGESSGRYRFVNNTIISGTSAVFRIFDSVESLEVHNNVFYNPNGDVLFKRTAEANWVSGQEVISGRNNWTKTGTGELPSQLQGTILGSNPQFINIAEYNLYPAENSPLINAGTSNTEFISAYTFPNPLPLPLKLPPNKQIENLDSSLNRDILENIDIGAFGN